MYEHMHIYIYIYIYTCIYVSDVLSLDNCLLRFIHSIVVL